MATGVGPTANTNAVKNALRYCRVHPCICLAEAIQRQVDGHNSPGGRIKGIMERIGNMLAPDADPPGTIFRGKDTWATHTAEIGGRQRSVENLLTEYEAQGCGSGGNGVGVIDEEAAKEAMEAAIPTPEEYWEKYPDGKPISDSPGFFSRVGLAVGGTVLLIGAGALIFVPFDGGPAGEYVVGSAGLAAWGLAVQ